MFAKIVKLARWATQPGDSVIFHVWHHQWPVKNLELLQGSAVQKVYFVAWGLRKTRTLWPENLDKQAVWCSIQPTIVAVFFFLRCSKKLRLWTTCSIHPSKFIVVMIWKVSPKIRGNTWEWHVPGSITSLMLGMVIPTFNRNAYNGYINPYYPIPSMYGIFAYIWWMFMVNVGRYTIHRWYGYWIDDHPLSHMGVTWEWRGCRHGASRAAFRQVPGSGVSPLERSIPVLLWRSGFKWKIFGCVSYC